MKRLSYHVTGSLVGLLFLVACNNNEKTAASAEVNNNIPLATQSKDATAAFQQGLEATDELNVQKARAAMTKAIQLDSNFVTAYLYRANLSQSPKDYIDDLAKAKTLLDKGSDWDKLYYDYQYTFVDNNWDKRLETIQKLVAAYPNAARAQVELGSTYQTASQTDKERTAFQKAIDLDPNWIGGYNALASSYLFSAPKDFKKATDIASQAAAKFPKSSSMEILLGDSYRALDSVEKARAAYASAIELNPADPNGYYKEGHANSFLGKYEEARNNYLQGAKYDETNLGAMLNIANTYLYAGDHTSALNFLTANCARVDSSGKSKSQMAVDQSSYTYACAMISLQDGDSKRLRDATMMMQKSSEQFANDVGSAEEKQVQAANILYWQAVADAMDGKLDDAKAKAAEIKSKLETVKLPNKLWDYNMLLGYIAMKEKKYADAIPYFEKANPNSIYSKYWEAKANEAAGNKDKANALYKEVAVYNFNGVEYAIIRSEVRKKLGMS